MEFFDISLETANKFYSWGWRASIGAAIATALALIVLNWGTRVRDRDMAAQLSATNFLSAQANERAASLELEAEAARLEQERLKAQFAWRTISEQTVQTLLDSLTGTAGTVTLAYTSGDPEALYLATQFSRVFQNVGWQIQVRAHDYVGIIVFGYVIPGPENADVLTIRNAFTAAEIPFRIDALPTAAVSYTTGAQNPTALVMFGSKPPPI